jgi:hypothetical protein
MNKRRVLIAALFAALVLALLMAKPLPRLKGRAQRIQAVNNAAPPFPQRTFVLTNAVVTNATPGKQK